MSYFFEQLWSIILYFSGLSHREKRNEMNNYDETATKKWENYKKKGLGFKFLENGRNCALMSVLLFSST